MDRKEKYALVYKVTKNSDLARTYRDRSMERIQKEVLDMYAPPIEVIIKRQMRNDTVRRKRYAIRSAGYSPAEADKMVSWSWDRINNVINNNVVIDPIARRKRWKYMSTRKKMDSNLETLARSLNERKHKEMLKARRSSKASDGLYKVDNNGSLVYDKNHNFGWSIVYYVYTRGADPEKWFKSVKIDPFMPEIYRLPNTVAF